MEQYLAHHGIQGMHWGVRRFQNDDGSLTPAGKERYGADGSNNKKSLRERINHARKVRKDAKKIEQEEFEKEVNKSELHKVWSESLKKVREELEGLDVDEMGEDHPYIQKLKARESVRAEDIEQLETKIREESAKKAYDQIRKKYGDQAIEDLEGYENAKAFLAISGISAVALSALFYARKHM